MRGFVQKRVKQACLIVFVENTQEKFQKNRRQFMSKQVFETVLLVRNWSLKLARLPNKPTVRLSFATVTPQSLQQQLCPRKWRRVISSSKSTMKRKCTPLGNSHGWMKREGRPSTDATLTARLIDRPIRPMFAEGFRNEVQVINTVLSYDPDASAPMAAMFGSSLALAISDIPFNGPIAGVQVGYVNGELIINPDKAQMEASLLDLTVAGNKDAINMVESGAKELSEDIMLEALLKGHATIQELLDFQNQIVAKSRQGKSRCGTSSSGPRIAG